MIEDGKEERNRNWFSGPGLWVEAYGSNVKPVPRLFFGFGGEDTCASTERTRHAYRSVLENASCWRFPQWQPAASHG